MKLFLNIQIDKMKKSNLITILGLTLATKFANAEEAKNVYLDGEIGGVVICKGSEEKCKISSIELIKEFEKFREEAYQCQAGKWTIGYGHIKGVSEGDKINRENAEKILKDEIKKYENALSRNVKVPLTMEQYNALVSFVYNIGIGAFEDSTLLKKLNQRDYVGAGNEFNRWIKVNGKVSDGLKKRRAREKEIFLKYLPK